MIKGTSVCTDIRWRRVTEGMDLTQQDEEKVFRMKQLIILPVDELI